MFTYFCDGLKDVTMLNGVIRLEFQRFESVEIGEKRELRPVSELVIAIPLQGFSLALGVLDTVRNRLIEEGIIKAVLSPEGKDPPQAPLGQSPNFP